MLMLLAIQTAAFPPGVTAPPPPPPIVSARTTPIYADADSAERQKPVQVTDIDAVIRAPSGVLWQGTLQVARGRESSWSQTRSEPPRTICPAPSHYGSEREMLSLSLTPVAGGMPGAMSGGMADSVMVNVRWTRRGDGACDGVRTVELRQSVVLADRQTVSVSGDGGLRVELRRR